MSLSRNEIGRYSLFYLNLSWQNTPSICMGGVEGKRQRDAPSDHEEQLMQMDAAQSGGNSAQDSNAGCSSNG